MDVRLPDGTIVRNVPEGITQSELMARVGKMQSPKAEQPIEQQRGLEDYLKLSSPIARGASFGVGEKLISAPLAALASKGIMEAQELMGGAQAPSLGELYKQAVGEIQNIGQEVRQDMPVTSTIAELGAGIGSGIGLGKTAAAQALGTLARRGGFAGRVGTGALAGEGAQRVYEAGSSELGREGEILGKKGISLGGVLGGVIPAASTAIKSGARVASRLATPKITENAQDFVALAKKHDVPLGADDLTDSNFYRHLIQKGGSLPFSGAASSAEKQLKSFTRAVAKSIGVNSDRLTPDVMDKAFESAGKKFDDLTKGKEFTFGDSALDALSSIQEGVNGGTYGIAGENLFSKYADDIFVKINNDILSGDDLAKLRNKFARIARTGTNLEAKALAKDFENVLVDMIGEDAPEALRKAKYQYKNLITIEPLARKAQETGIISPAQLTGRVSTVYGRDFTRGKAGELGELARLGQVIKQKVPDSGTPIGNAVMNVLAGGGLYAINPALIPSAGVGLGINRAIQSRNVSPQFLGRITGQSQLPAVTHSNPVPTGLQTGRALGQLQTQQ